MKLWKHTFYKEWIHTAKLTVTQMVPDEPWPIFALKRDRERIVGVGLIGEAFPSSFDGSLQRALRFHDVEPSLEADGPQSRRLEGVLRAVANFDIKWNEDAEAKNNIYYACMERLQRTATVFCISQT